MLPSSSDLFLLKLINAAHDQRTSTISHRRLTTSAHTGARPAEHNWAIRAGGLALVWTNARPATDHWVICAGPALDDQRTT
ncbi:hypothetical protein Q3G72_007217 [Acer saccharum]|nr:hypothetical protein Q3G72_007217 [Acer saccharum]